jgi:hypothetical protein
MRENKSHTVSDLELELKKTWVHRKLRLRQTHEVRQGIWIWGESLQSCGPKLSHFPHIVVPSFVRAEDLNHSPPSFSALTMLCPSRLLHIQHDRPYKSLVSGCRMWMWLVSLLTLS